MRLGFIMLTISLLVLCSSKMASAACEEDTIDIISEDGDLIVLTSGTSYNVGAGDQVTASEWQEGDDVLICGDTIIDKDQGGEQVDVTPH